MKILKGFDGHIVLLCKGHYKCFSLVEGLRMIWSVKCGHEYNLEDHSADRYIANKLYKLLKLLTPDRIEYLQEKVHDDIACDWRFDPLYSALQRIILIYCSEIADITIKEKEGEEWITLIELPEPNKKVLERILRGKGKYEDYWLIESKE